ncbi:MAG: L-serine ammonia-lyase, iron-sulfur-dependent, subunit alpha [Defluviitaleaceae bacterium]|nr:L-serine ammonia-lyase, iron-sulfur-dependent, subunit alpha [Defluviitaleaceae bacterium]
MIDIKQYPSIFNDVIGPVMIGHSSSHTAASVRIGNVVRQLAYNKNVKKVKFSFDSKSSLATTYKSQGSDIGLLAGILGFETDDKRIPDAYEYTKEAGIDCIFEVKEIGEGHPNAYYIEFVSSDNKLYHLTALSVGGGMIEITDYMGFNISVDGGFFETLIMCDDSDSKSIIHKINCELKHDYIINLSHKDEKSLINVKSKEELAFDFISINSEIVQLHPILPVMSQIDPKVPFITAKEIYCYAKGSNMSLYELAVLYESERSGLSVDAIISKMNDIVKILEMSIEATSSSEVKDRILQNQSHLIEMNDNVIGGSFNKNIIKYVTRFMDIKTSMGVFVAAPTAGSCGCISGCLFALKKELNLSNEKIAHALLSSGLIGVIIAHHSTFAAEVCGCQAECGVGSGMAAAVVAEISGGSVKTCLGAASMALQNILGLVCDPVGNKVEVPCLGKNILAAFNAVASANMAVSGFDVVIPLDETISALDSVGRSIPHELRCTGLGGLSTTKTSLEMLERFNAI